MWAWYQHLFSSRQTGKLPFNAIGPREAATDALLTELTSLSNFGLGRVGDAGIISAIGSSNSV